MFELIFTFIFLYFQLYTHFFGHILTPQTPSHPVAQVASTGSNIQFNSASEKPPLTPPKDAKALLRDKLKKKQQSSQHISSSTGSQATTSTGQTNSGQTSIPPIPPELLKKETSTTTNTSTKFYDQLGSAEYDTIRTHLQVGDFLYKEPLFALSGKGIDYEFSLYYKSNVSYNSPYGQNWSYEYNDFIVIADNGDITLTSGSMGQVTFKKVSETRYENKANGMNIVSVDDVNGGRTYTLTLENTKDQYTFYGAKGQKGYSQNTIQDANGNKITIKDNNFGVQEVTDTKGQKIFFYYNTLSHLYQIVTPEGDNIYFEYYKNGDEDGSDGDLARIKSENGETKKITRTIVYTYQKGTHRLHTVDDPVAKYTLENKYDSKGRLIYYKTKDGVRTYEYTEDSQGRIITNTCTDREGNKNRFTFDSNGNEIKVENLSKDEKTSIGETVNTSTKYIYDDKSRIIKEILPLGNGQEITYDEKGREVGKLLKPDMSKSGTEGLYIEYKYDGDEKTPKSVVFPDGTEIPMDDSVNPFKFNELVMGIGSNLAVNSVSDTGSFDYVYLGKKGGIQGVTYSADKLSSTINLNKDVLKIISVLAIQVKEMYGIYLRALNSESEVTYLGKNKNGDLNKVIYSDEVEVSYTYGNKLVIKKTQKNHDDSESAIFYKYDKNGQLLEKSDENGKLATYTYDLYGRVTKVADKKGNSIEYTYGKSFTSIDVKIYDSTGKEIPFSENKNAQKIDNPATSKF